MVNCNVYGCKNRTERNQPNITFHRFPNNPQLKDAWIKCTRRINWNPKSHSRICSKHFDPSCFQQKSNRTYLNPHSIPTLFMKASVRIRHDMRLLCINFVVIGASCAVK
ncbi:unnamed protein product [Pieris macdunnoughi]|uniref:THAP-type domain-containing protein n=1 Tax=Pieris macdunnoughi TaxID=345717 RepID=A0A821XU57_9NEOP|nr:unnamed protein product [Pieris macdunnoughi]